MTTARIRQKQAKLNMFSENAPAHHGAELALAGESNGRQPTAMVGHVSRMRQAGPMATAWLRMHGQDNAETGELQFYFESKDTGLAAELTLHAQGDALSTYQLAQIKLYPASYDEPLKDAYIARVSRIMDAGIPLEPSGEPLGAMCAVGADATALLDNTLLLPPLMRRSMREECARYCEQKQSSEQQKR